MSQVTNCKNGVSHVAKVSMSHVDVKKRPRRSGLDLVIGLNSHSRRYHGKTIYKDHLSYIQHLRLR